VCKETLAASELAAIQDTAAQNNPVDESEKFHIFSPTHFSSNLHTPKFENSSLLQRVTVRENAEVGERVVAIRATDADYGFNSRLAYVISSGNDADVFTIDSYSGDITLAVCLDRESQDHYVINVTVFDIGTPPRHASMMLDISVEDVNDYYPQFKNTPYAVRISEDVELNSTIFWVHAVDDDLDENGQVSYRIEGRVREFVIDERTGLIRIASRLDREVRYSYVLIVTATDQSTGTQLVGTTTLSVTVEDVNDNPPVFVPDTGYRLEIPEDMPVETIVTTLYAYDADDGINGQVCF